MPFTRSGDPVAEDYVQNLVEHCVNRIAAEISPVAIYLQGSFGRGEGTVLLDAGSGPQLWRDLDLVIIARARVNPSKIAALRAELLRYPGVVSGATTAAGGDISLAQIPLPLALRWRDLKMQELAHRSHHLWGKDIRLAMAVRDGKIPIESGLRFLLQKAIGLCLVFPLLEREPTTANYEVAKTYIEITNTLALREGAPSTSQEERLAAMAKSADSRVRELVERARRWAAFKTEGRTQQIAGIPAAEAWLGARTDLLAALELCSPGADLSTSRGLQAYHRRLSRSFLPTTFAATITRSWPPGLGARAFGRTAQLGFRGYAALRLGSSLRTGCPLATTYVAALAALIHLTPGKDVSDAVQASAAYLHLVGEPAPDPHVQGWEAAYERAYHRVAKPLYGASSS